MRWCGYLKTNSLTMTHSIAPIEQPSLFPVPPEEPAIPLSPPSHPSLPQRSAVTTDTLLAEIERDWWSLLDPRNWRDPGPTDEEILARYRAAGTPTTDNWPNVSGSRMYSLVWPTLRQTYHVPEDRLLAACQTCRSRHLLGAFAHTRTAAIAYSISDDLISKHIWNGDSWATYTALARFAHQPAASLEDLATDALQLAIPHAAAALHTALATRYRLPVELRPSKHTNAKEQTQKIDTAIAQSRERLKTLHQYRRASLLREPFSNMPLLAPASRTPRGLPSQKATRCRTT